VVAIRAATTPGSLRAGRQLHCCVAKLGSCDDGNQYLACALLDMYTKCGQFDEASESGEQFVGNETRSFVLLNHQRFLT
jgi:hypothetical protein